MIELRSADNHPAWCPGCGNFPILAAVDEALDAVKVDRRKLVLVSGIGQAAKLPHYTRANVFNGLHGRAIPAATGIKLANTELEVVIVSGDGDMYGEGGNHLIHAMRRNIGITAFVHNNQVYGLTKGQASPTSDPGFTTPVQIHGTKSAALNPLAMAIAANCSFVARSFSGAKEHLVATMSAAIEHRGFALVDILQPCFSFNHVNTFKWYRDRVRPIGDYHDTRNREAAMRLAMKWGDEIPIGIIYESERKPYEKTQEVLASGTLVDQYRRLEAVW